VASSNPPKGWNPSRPAAAGRTVGETVDKIFATFHQNLLVVASLFERS
jgi:hypothetical protein